MFEYKRYLWRGLSVLILAGLQVFVRILKGKVHWKNTLQQLERVGPKSVGVCLLTSAVVGMAFTIQFVREFTRLWLNRSVGVIALAFSRELSPVITSIVAARRIGSAFAAELGTTQVFGAITSVVSCAWGVTTLGGAKGVGESPTSTVVISLVGIFIDDFALLLLLSGSWRFIE
ncbi:Protein TRIGALACTOSYLDIACYLGLYCEROL 1 [Forsythia ovata]|uniref:Protein TRIGALACTOSYLDIACYLGLYCEROL 1 n=1 Tax=Forsythia ovata TaxID=205694 RepID=A0ABD1T5D6_9LAMI